MILHTIIAAIVLLALVIPALGLKQFFDKDAESVVHSCDNGKKDSGESCSFCPSDETTNGSLIR